MATKIGPVFLSVARAVNENIIQGPGDMTSLLRHSDSSMCLGRLCHIPLLARSTALGIFGRFVGDSMRSDMFMTDVVGPVGDLIQEIAGLDLIMDLLNVGVTTLVYLGAATEEEDKTLCTLSAHLTALKEATEDVRTNPPRELHPQWAAAPSGRGRMMLREEVPNWGFSCPEVGELAHMFLSAQDLLVARVLEETMAAAKTADVPVDAFSVTVGEAVNAEELKAVELSRGEFERRNAAWADLLGTEATPCVTVSYREPVLSLAVSTGNHALVKTLLDWGMDPNVTVFECLTPLTIAVANNNLPMIGLLLRAGADPNFATPLGVTPMHLMSSVHAFDLLIRAGANPRAVTTTGTSVLFAASMNIELVNALLATMCMHRLDLPRPRDIVAMPEDDRPKALSLIQLFACTGNFAGMCTVLGRGASTAFYPKSLAEARVMRDRAFLTSPMLTSIVRAGSLDLEDASCISLCIQFLDAFTAVDLKRAAHVKFKTTQHPKLLARNPLFVPAPKSPKHICPPAFQCACVRSTPKERGPDPVSTPSS